MSSMRKKYCLIVYIIAVCIPSCLSVLHHVDPLVTMEGLERTRVCLIEASPNMKKPIFSNQCQQNGQHGVCYTVKYQFKFSDM